SARPPTTNATQRRARFAFDVARVVQPGSVVPAARGTAPESPGPTGNVRALSILDRDEWSDGTIVRGAAIVATLPEPNGAIAAASSWTVWNLSVAVFCSAPKIARSRSCGTSGRSCVSDGGGSRQIAAAAA